MLLLHFIALLFEHFSIILRNVRESRERHDDTEEKMKSFLFCLCIVDLGTITGFLVGLQRLSPKGGILSYAKFTYLENTSP